MKRLFSIFFIFFLFSCNQIKLPYLDKIKFIKNLKVKKPEFKKIVVACDRKYIQTIEGSISKKILVDYFIKNRIKNYRIKSLKHDDVIKSFKNKKSDIMIIDPFNGDINNSGGRISMPFLSDGVYFLTFPKNSRYININNLTGDIKTGYQHDSYGSAFIENIYCSRKNNFEYFMIDNLLEDFKQYKLDLIAINRQDYYKNCYTLPAKVLSYINYGRPYSSVVFRRDNLRERFNNYLIGNSRNFDWSNKVFNKSAYIKYFDDFLKQTDSFIKKAIADFKSME